MCYRYRYPHSEDNCRFCLKNTVLDIARFSNVDFGSKTHFGLHLGLHLRWGKSHSNVRCVRDGSYFIFTDR